MPEFACYVYAARIFTPQFVYVSVFLNEELDDLEMA